MLPTGQGTKALQIGSLTGSLTSLSASFPFLVTLKLTDVRPTFSDLQSLSQLSSLRNLCLQDIHCTRETFSQCPSPGEVESVFSHLQQLTALDMQQNSKWCIGSSTKYLTEDLQGLSFMTNLHRLSVKTLYMPVAAPTFGLRIPYSEPLVPCNRLLDLSHLIHLHLDSARPGLTAMASLSSLHIRSLPDDNFPENFSALQSLTQLNVGVGRVREGDIAALSALTDLSHLTLRGYLCCAWLHDMAERPWAGFTLLKSLKQLDLIGVNFDGEMFDILTTMTQLTGLVLSFNQLPLDSIDMPSLRLSSLINLQSFKIGLSVSGQRRMSDVWLPCRAQMLFQIHLPGVPVSQFEY